MGETPGLSEGSNGEQGRGWCAGCWHEHLDEWVLCSERRKDGRKARRSSGKGISSALHPVGFNYLQGIKWAIG